MAPDAHAAPADQQHDEHPFHPRDAYAASVRAAVLACSAVLA